MSLSTRLAVNVGCIAVALSACGGGGGEGGGGGGGSSGQPGIAAVVLGFPTGAAPPGFTSGQNNTGVIVQVVNQDGVTPITNATVTVNGVALTYFAANQDYEGQLNINPSATVTLRVTISASYSLTRNSALIHDRRPCSRHDMVVIDSNLVSWSGAAPFSTSSFALGVFDTNGNLQWPTSGGFLELMNTMSSYTIAANQLSAGDRLVLLGLIDVFAISGALQGSGLLLGGFNYTPITIMAGSLVLTSVSTSPASATVGVARRNAHRHRELRRWRHPGSYDSSDVVVLRYFPSSGECQWNDHGCRRGDGDGHGRVWRFFREHGRDSVPADPIARASAQPVRHLPDRLRSFRARDLRRQRSYVPARRPLVDHTERRGFLSAHCRWQGVRDHQRE
jgi:hypothetical protein